MPIHRLIMTERKACFVWDQLQEHILIDVRTVFYNGNIIEVVGTCDREEEHLPFGEILRGSGTYTVHHSMGIFTLFLNSMCIRYDVEDGFLSYQFTIDSEATNAWIQENEGTNRSA